MRKSVYTEKVTSPRKSPPSPKQSPSPRKSLSPKLPTIQRQINVIVKKLLLLDDPKGEEYDKYLDLITQLNHIATTLDKKKYIKLNAAKPDTGIVTKYKNVLKKIFDKGNFHPIFEDLKLIDVENAMQQAFEENAYHLYASMLDIISNGWNEDFLSERSMMLGKIFTKLAQNKGVEIPPIPRGESYETYIKENLNF